jgi:hypothetical protein
MQVVVALVVVFGTIIGTGAALSAMQSDNGAGLHITVLPAPTSLLISNELFLSGNIITVALTISDVAASNIGYYSATISWKTNGDASSQVFYDTESRASPEAYANSTTEETTGVNEHSISLTGLSSSTTYHYMVRSAIPDTKFIAISEDYTFKTLTPAGGGGGGFGAGDTTPPTISDILVSNITKTSADITWGTNEKSDSQGEYWSSPSKFSPLDTERVINHLVHLTDLTPGTSYYYKVMSRDAADNLAVSDVYAFATLPGVAAFTGSKLSISPGEVYIGETVAISVLITNTGDGAGSYGVTLKINGVVEATKDITLNAGASGEVAFTTAKDVAGSYSVEVDGLSSSFAVKEKPALPEEIPPEEAPPVKAPINWPLIGGIIAAVVVVGLGVFFWMRRKAA